MTILFSDPPRTLGPNEVETPYKSRLTYEEAIKCAYLAEIREINQHDLAVAFEVNPGRVNEALQTIREALKGYR